MASNKGLQSPCESHDSLSTQLTNKSRLWTWKKGWWQSNRHNALQLRPKTALVDYEPELLSHLSLCHDLRTRWGQPGTFLQTVRTFFAKTVALTISPGFQPWILREQTLHFTSHNGLQDPGHVFIITIDGLLVDQRYLELCIVLIISLPFWRSKHFVKLVHFSFVLWSTPPGDFA